MRNTFDSLQGPILLTINIFTILVVLTVTQAHNEYIQIHTTFVPQECPKKSERGNILTVHYTANDGKVLIDSWAPNKPFQFQIGVGEVMRGWDEGLHSMCVGEKRKLIVQPQSHSGDDATGPTLYYEIELLKIEKSHRNAKCFGKPDCVETNVHYSLDQMKERFMRDMPVKRADERKPVEKFDDKLRAETEGRGSGIAQNLSNEVNNDEYPSEEMKNEL